MKHFRMIFLVSLFCLLFSLCAFAAGTVSVGSVAAKKGDTVQIPVTLSGNTGFASLGIEIGYDNSVLSLTDVTEGSVGATFTKAQTLTTNPYNLGWSCADNNTFNGTLATLTFSVLTDTAGDYPISVSYYKGRNGNYTDGYDVNYDENFDALGLSYKNGSVTIEGITPSGAVVSVGSASAKKGDTVQVPVTLSGNTGFASLGIEIGYDSSVLSLTDVTEGSVGATFTKAQTLTTNPYNLGWSCAENNTFNGTLATLTFSVLTDTAGDYPISVSYYKGRNGNYTDGYDVNYDENFEALGLSYVGGNITVEGTTPTGAVVSVGSASGKKGDTVQIPVILSGNTGFASLGIEIGYDSSVLSLTDVTEGLVGATFTKAQTLTTNPYNLGWSCAENNTFNGTLVTLTFSVLTDITGEYPLSVSYYKGRNGNYIDGFDVNYDENFEALGLSYVGGNITIGGTEMPTVQVNIGKQTITLVSDTTTFSGAVLVAHFNSDGRMIELASFPAASSITPDLSAPTQGDTVTALWWHDVASMQPLADSGTVTIP